MPTKPSKRDYKREYANESRERKDQRAARNRARRAYEKEHGDLPSNVHVDHKRPLSRGGTNDKSNLRAVAKDRNEKFDRDGPGGKPVTRRKR